MNHQSAHGKICYLIMPGTHPARSAASCEDVVHWAIRTHDDGSATFDDATATAAMVVKRGSTKVEEPVFLSEHEAYAVLRDVDRNRLGPYNHGCVKGVS